jgi:hypothetical protein
LAIVRLQNLQASAPELHEVARRAQARNQHVTKAQAVIKSQLLDVNQSEFWLLALCFVRR